MAEIRPVISELHQIPEAGQLVEVRRRQWVVTDVNGSNLPHDLYQNQHLVSLESIDEDALGEELQVIWQLEPGAKILEKVGLPVIDGYDTNDKLNAFLDAVRWGAASNADRQFLQSPFRSGISIEDYQLDPLVRALDRTRVNLLIADDVGLGKTIEAGLVIQELLIRHRARTVFVVCPASLQIKWQNEMREKFGLEFRIVDTSYIKTLRRERGLHTNPWTSYPRLITSMDWIKSGEGLRLLKDCLPPQRTYPRKFDILLVDEAHNIAPAMSAPSLRTLVIQRLTPHFTHHLFLTATPHNGYQSSFTSLLELLDDQRFAKSVMPKQEQLQQVMVRRLKSNIVDSKGQSVFPKRELKCLEIEYTDEEREIHKLLQEFTQLRFSSVQNSQYAFGTEFVHMLLKKRLFSSPAAFARTLEKHRESLLTGKKKEMVDKFDDRILHRAISQTKEDYFDEMLFEEATNEVVSLDADVTVPLTEEEKKLLNRLYSWAEKAKNKSDSKSDAIISWLNEYLKPNGQWNDKRVILFTEYRDTQSWLQTILAHNGFGGKYLMVMHGGLNPEEREEVKAAFQTSTENSPVRILLATDAASEGIDLQNYCNYLIHVEIPWNPNVMEQRNGRIDRHGQNANEVLIWHPVGKGFSTKTQNTKPGKIEGDHEYLMRAVLKVDAIREDLGAVGSVIASQIEDAMLGRNTTVLNIGSDAEEKRKKASGLITVEKKLQEKIAGLHKRLMESRTDFHLSPDNVAHAVNVALEIAGKPLLKERSISELPPRSAFDVPALSGSWSLALKGLNHPHTGVKRAITFDQSLLKGREDLVLAHLNHRLVQMSLRLLREEIWKLDDVKKLHRVAIRSLSDLDAPVVVVFSRLLITGGDHHRLHEELTVAGGELRHDRFRRITTLGELDQFIKNSFPLDMLPDSGFSALKDRFQRNAESIMAAVNARSKERLRDLEHSIQLRKESEIRDIIHVLDELENNIREELKEPAYIQRQFEFMEEGQLEKDIKSLKTRLERIPSEKESEKAVIEKHYADPQPRTFPVAVIFLVPQTKAWGVK